MHRYLYAYANPTVYVDLNGYESSRVYKDENDIPVDTQYFRGSDGLYYEANGDYGYTGEKYASWVSDQQANSQIQTRQDPRAWYERAWDSTKETATNLYDKAKGAVTVAESNQKPGTDAPLTEEEQYQRDFGSKSRLTHGANTVAEVSSAGADVVDDYCSMGCNPASILKGALVVGGTKQYLKHKAERELAEDAASIVLKAKRSEKANGAVTGFDDLAKFRRELNLPAAGAAADKSTLSVIEVNGKKIFGINAHGQPVSGVNVISSTHAEIDALNQIKQQGIDVSGQSLKLYVDRTPCTACGTNGGIRTMVEQLGLKKLTVIGPDGPMVITPR